jgi:hypothetical protein
MKFRVLVFVHLFYLLAKKSDTVSELPQSIRLLITSYQYCSCGPIIDLYKWKFQTEGCI